MRECVNGLEEKTYALKQYSRRNSLRISGIPEREGEDVLCDTQPGELITSPITDNGGS